MERSQHFDAGYREQDVPPGTPPVIDASADPRAAARFAMAGGDRDYPGEQPDEIVPDQGDVDEPQRTPDEVAPGQGDFDQPDRSQIEMPPAPDVAPETPPPPD